MATPNDGYIRLHRRIREHPYWQDAERLRAWLDCLFMAAWKPHRRMVGTRQIELERGEFLASEPFLAARWGWSRGKVRRFLKAAIEAGEIEPTGNTSDGTVYLVVKYDTYQDPRPSNGTGNSTGNGQGAGQASDIREGRERTGRKDTKKKKPPTGSKKKKRSRAVQLPDDWTPNDQHRELARSRGVNLEEEAMRFKDHARATGRTLKDWDAGFRNWIRKAEEFNAGAKPPAESEAAQVKEELPQQTGPRSGPPEPHQRELDDGVDEETREKIKEWARQNKAEATELWQKAENSLDQLTESLRRRGADDRADAMVRREWYRLARSKVA